MEYTVTCDRGNYLARKWFESHGKCMQYPVGSEGDGLRETLATLTRNGAF
jgi:hypothetical protein